MTANALAHQRAAYIAAGMNGAVAKPLSPAALVQAIAAVLGQPADAASRAS
jgi:CheY-like chemotaxis protein